MARGNGFTAKCVETYLPNSILRRPKRGFAGNVVDDWFRSSIDSTMADTLLDSGSMVYRFLQARAVRTLVEQHASGRHDHHKTLFSLVVLEQWLRAQESRKAVLT